ncbi:MAG: hypothetical protein U0172_03200 [Nitrospiraceae bacterium]
MYVWSKKLVGVLLVLFVLLDVVFFVRGVGENASGLKSHTTQWIALNYIGLIVWVFVWMIDQARMRGHNVWLWVVPFVLAPLPTLMAYVLYLQRRIR